MSRIENKRYNSLKQRLKSIANNVSSTRLPKMNGSNDIYKLYNLRHDYMVEHRDESTGHYVIDTYKFIAEPTKEQILICSLFNELVTITNYVKSRTYNKHHIVKVVLGVMDKTICLISISRGDTIEYHKAMDVLSNNPSNYHKGSK